MKTKFKMIGKDEVSISIELQLEANRFVLTRDEFFIEKQELQNDVHRLLRDLGYDVSQIYIVNRK